MGPEWTPPTFRWFSGAQTNLAWNCVDHHVARGRGGHAALIGVNELGERRTYTYGQLLREVERLARALRGMGIGGDGPRRHVRPRRPANRPPPLPPTLSAM